MLNPAEAKRSDGNNNQSDRGGVTSPTDGTPNSVVHLIDLYSKSTTDKLFHMVYSINQSQISHQGCPSFFCVCYSYHHRHHHNLFARSDISSSVHLRTYSEYLLFCLLLLYLAIRLYTRGQ